MATIKTIYPPIVPSYLPAFDGVTTNLKFYFKPSIANAYSEIKGIHVTIAKMDTNRSMLSRTDYPFDIMIIEPKDIQYDDVKKYYYFTIDRKIFTQLDTAYKIQIRAVESKASAMPSKPIRPSGMSDDAWKNQLKSWNTQMNQWLKDNLDYFSEWSVVTTVMPIKPPSFGIQGLDDGKVNAINSSGFVFTGYYNPQDINKAETLSMYRLDLFEYKNFDDKATWKLYATSGDKTIGAYEKPTINEVFDKDLEQGKDYVIAFSIKTKNLFTKTIYYKIRAEYPVLELFNTISAVGNKDEGLIELTVNAKQILMSPSKGSTVEYIADDPAMSSEPYLTASHAVIKGDIYTNKNFTMIADEGKWIIQTKVKIDEVHTDIKKVYDNPFITVKYNTETYGDIEYSTRIKFCAFKIDLNGDYPLMQKDGTIVRQAKDYEYRIIARKEIVSRDGRQEQVLLSQNKIYRTKEEIVPQQEYYIFLKEDEGLMSLNVQKTYRK